jgi:hypothetical protein
MREGNSRFGRCVKFARARLRAQSAIFRALTPAPGITLMRPAACATSSPINCARRAHRPARRNVSTRSQPSAMMCSSAVSGE